MSRGRPEDLQNTKNQIKNPNPVAGDLTWLRHNIRDQSGEIDLLLLKGGTLEDMAIELIKMGLDKEKLGVEGMKRRVLRHIKMNCAPIETSDRNYGHNLSSVLRESPLKIWKFSFEEVESNPDNFNKFEEVSINKDIFGYIPTKEDIFLICKIVSPKGQEIRGEVLKRSIEKYFMDQCRRLHEDWWEYTKKNLEDWSKQK
ncbi:MAG: hypothetical protein AB1585_04615 [Thermodesulfobacteriota bacterium]